MGIETKYAQSTDEGKVHVLDAIGEVCPYPLLQVQMAMENVSPGEVLEIHFDCGLATETIPEWTQNEGHEQLSLTQHDEQWTIRIRKVK